jgi:hypothetical protein
MRYLCKTQVLDMTFPSHYIPRDSSSKSVLKRKRAFVHMIVGAH